MLTLHEGIDDRGAPRLTRVDFEGGTLRLFMDDEIVGTVTVDALAAVMARYGKPVADGVALEGPSLALGPRRALRVLRHRAYYDVIARDFAVLEWDGDAPLAELATTIAAALVHLARAGAARRPVTCPSP